jgi:beta-N-acetylhexosaminidase
VKRGSNHLQYYIILTILSLSLALTTVQSSQVKAQEPADEIEAAVETVFKAMTPHERVGQLFMVSFISEDVASGSSIARLIQTYRIGGVVLSASNENFSNEADTPSQVLRLTNALQGLAQQGPKPVQINNDELVITSPSVTSPLTTTATLTPTVESYAPVPLFVAIRHDGDGYPFTQIRQGLTKIPSQMAIGATWNPENARLVGRVVGHELSLLGINMLFGPSLDVLDRPERGGSLGTRTFGGHPFWVEQMGEAYIRGVHQGSNKRLLTVATHFPGFGSSDRRINQEIPIINKSLDDLRRTELPPFFRVTRLMPDEPEAALNISDGLMTAHIRYQGLQGNVPISLDARNLPALLALKEIAPWRKAGGLIVSAPLGAPAALEGINAGRDNFPARRLAQDALFAGSDVLLLENFAFADRPARAPANIIDAIRFFREKYASDPNFQTLVDRAVRNILRAKIKVYGPDLLNVTAQQPLDNLDSLNEISLDLDRMAQEGVTLISPITQEGLNPLPGPPQPGDNILIFTDSREVQDCPFCPEFSLIEPTALREIILRLFGPRATGQIDPGQITTLSFADLKSALAETSSSSTGDTGQSLEAQLKSADWIIFAMLDIAPQSAPDSDAVRLLLRNRYEMIRNKRLVLFAFNAPYFLDETEISQLTAYYAFYSKEPDYLETAARLLFQQFEPAGAAPVSIPAIGALNLGPTTNQSIQLEPVEWIDTNGIVTPLEPHAKPINTLDLKVGEGIVFRTSVIIDSNGQPVPDGTVVNFFRSYPLENLSLEPVEAKTVMGVAEIIIIKERDTPLQVRASSGLASESVAFNIGPGIVDTPTPTATATATATATPTTTATPDPTATATNSPTPTLEPSPTATPLPLPPPPLPPPVNIIDLTYALLGMILIGIIAFTLGGDRFSLEERIRPALVALALGLVGYICYTIVAMVFPESAYIAALVKRSATGHWVAPLISLLFAIAGMVAWYLKPGRIFWTNSAKKGLSPSKEE